MRIKKLTDTAIIPTRATDGSAGYDLYVDMDSKVVIKPHQTVFLPTNISMEIPKGYFGAIYARSGLSTKQGLRPATCVSVIDSDYRGGVGLPMHNDTDEEKIINPHERVAQMVIQPYFSPDIQIVDSLGETDRGSNGFGSSGK